MNRVPKIWTKNCELQAVKRKKHSRKRMIFFPVCLPFSRNSWPRKTQTQSPTLPIPKIHWILRFSMTKFGETISKTFQLYKVSLSKKRNMFTLRTPQKNLATAVCTIQMTQQVSILCKMMGLDFLWDRHKRRRQRMRSSRSMKVMKSWSRLSER